MVVLVAFLLPVVVFVVAARMLRRRRVTDPAGRTARVDRASMAAAAAVGAAALCTGAVFATITRSAFWSERTQIAWIGVEGTTARDALVVGGPAESATIGWPLAGSWPQLSALALGGGRARLQVVGGYGVVVVEPIGADSRADTRSAQTLNGLFIGSGQTVESGGFHIRFRDRWFFDDEVTIGKGPTTVARVPLRWGASGVISIVPELTGPIGALRASGDAARLALALELEDWSSHHRLARDGGGVRLVPARQGESPPSWTAADVALPTRVTVRWPGRMLPMDLAETPDGRVKLTFLPPWRLASPMPPAVEGSTDIPLTLTTDPRPGERVFRLPFGPSISDPRRVLTLRTATAPPQFAGGRVQRLDDVIDLPPGVQLDDDVRRFRPAGLTSLLAVPIGPLALQMATVQDLPTHGRLALLLAIGLAAFAAGVAGTRRVLAAADTWPIYGLALTLWLFLAARLLLSIRYAADPTGLDRLAVQGVALAALALAVFPGLFFLTIRLYRDAFLPRERRERARTFYAFVACLALLAAAAWLQVDMAADLWPNLPERFTPDIGWVFGLLLAGVFMLFLAQGAYTYLLEADGQARLWWLSPLSAVQKWVFGYGVRFWQRARTWRATRRRFMVICVALLILYAAVTIALSILNVAAGNQRIVQEFVGPFLLLGVPLLLWLSSRAAVVVGRAPILSNWRALLFLSAVTVFPALLSPIFLRDVGGIAAALAWFAPFAALLIAVPPRRYGVWPAMWSAAVVALAAGFLVASVTILPGAAVSVLERGVSRYLVFSRGLEAQRLLPLAQWSPELGDGVPLRSLQNTIGHGWENVAIAHRGKWLGTGFSKAPVRRSMVPQETLQYDSTFSFFIVSEHGAIGGFALLLLYAAPLGMVLWSARRRVDVGHLLAAVVAAGFLGEALLHAAMNYGSMPFTGRNLPLLSVNSATEVLRWTVLWCLAAQALLWRSAAGEHVFSPRYGAPASRTTPEGSGRLWRAVTAAILIVPILFFVPGIAIPAVRVALDRELDAPFGWDRLLASVQSLIDANRIVWDGSAKQISLRGLGVRLEGTTFLEQEVARFNSLPHDEKLDLPDRVALPLGRIRTLEEYDAALHSLWRTTTQLGRRPSLFTISLAERMDGSSGEPENYEKLEANPAFNIRLSFAPDIEPSRIPSVTIPTSNKGRTVQLMGPAWVSGRWEVGVNPEARVPWVGVLASALTTEWARAGAEAASARYGGLTLDSELQNGAMAFAAEKGRARHGQLLAIGGAPRRQLPPRVALSIVDMRDGRVLALGGWPHMSATSRWTWSGAGGWSPPAEWLDRHASRAIAARYGRDRNFDRIEVGSGGKPFWAAAALSVHPQLDRLLLVQGADQAESDVFGIPVKPKPWKVTPSGWRTFRDYLMLSDNRYHVRVGFVGVAAAAGRGIRADTSAGQSASVKESLSGAPQPWGRYPLFVPEVSFSAKTPDRMTLLHQTALAQALSAMFNAGIQPGDTPSYRTSLWSLVDSAASDRSPIGDQFLLISPESTQLRLDLVSTPRKFISQLLGGSDSRWANVEYAAAFSTAVTGHPLVPHLIPGEAKPREARRAFPEIAARLRPGLAGAVRDASGTATGRLRTAGASAVFWPNLQAYGKSGTLSTDDGKTETSRLVVALVRWKDQAKGIVDSGVVLSLVVERAEMGAASSWLGEFIARYGHAISRTALR